MQNPSESGDYWVRGFLQLSEQNQKLYYIGCSNCFSKINVEAGICYTCALCNKEVISCLRPIVIMSVTDYTGSMEVVSIQNIADQILQATPTKISELQNLVNIQYG
ncbi:hypothetical protein LIER_28061 [Lithospermum erythrorhizon]|uniref:Replication factor A C-terminal domain-containing protein n=1 Tax=Lithospermum erythrorhizon TaxID=34254 RepID=A0AAV3RFE3_LITER